MTRALVWFSLALTLCAPAVSASRRAVRPQPVVYVAVFTHNEDPHHPETPDFSRDRAAYIAFRAALLDFAHRLDAAQIPWNWQSDWNFLNAVLLYEEQQRDASLLGVTSGKNVVRYLREDLGVEIDPHSHENDGYNYADVAYLIERCGVVPSGVVGGHIWDPREATYQNWPRFLPGLAGSRYPQYVWRPWLLMGGGSPSHRNDPTVTGIWRPKSPVEYFVAGTTDIAAFGGWAGTNSDLENLIIRVRTGELSSTRMWTATVSFNQSDLVKPGFIAATVAPRIDQLVAMRSSGVIEVVQFEQARAIWQARYLAASSVFAR